MTIISVTNNGADDFSCKYDGTLYSFPAGETFLFQKTRHSIFSGLASPISKK